MKARIVLSSLLLFVCAAASCAESWSADDDPVASESQAVEGDLEANGIGTSPSVNVSDALKPCGLWFAHVGGIDAAYARYLAAPAKPDLLRVPRPGGLSCSALLAVSLEHPYFAGRSVVYYVAPVAP